MNIKLLFLVPLAFTSAITLSDDPDHFFTETGQVRFQSIAFDAKSSEVTSSIDLNNYEFKAEIPVNSFVFKREYKANTFKKKYMEVEEFPMATFEGTFHSDNDISNKVEGIYFVKASGTCTIRGVTKQVDCPFKLVIGKNGIIATANATININDYGIELSKILHRERAKFVEISVKMVYVPHD